MKEWTIGDWVKIRESGDSRLWRVAGFEEKSGAYRFSDDRPRIICEVGIPNTKSYDRNIFSTDELEFIAKASTTR